jgi:hypothetical protein
VAADKLAQRINSSVADFRSKRFLGMDNANYRELRTAVKRKTGKISCSGEHNHVLSSPDLVNQFYATIATVDDYILKKTINNQNIPYTQYHLFQ